MSTAEDSFGPIDVLCSNAGFSSSPVLSRAKAAGQARHLAGQAGTTFRLAQAIGM